MDEPRYRRILQAVCETPWAILPSKLAVIVELLAFRAEGGRLTPEEIQARIDAAAPGNGRPSYATFAGSGGNVAVIPIHGVIMPRATLFSEISGGVSLQRVQQAVQQAIGDPAVNAILLDIDSPGGSVSLVTETAAVIRNARGQDKPIVAVADTMAASAAYCLAAQADELVVTPSGEVGSIGVIAIHQDVSRALDAAGITTTMVTFGENKANGYPYEPLSEKAQAEIQSSVDEFGRMFESDVAKGRGVSAATVHSSFGQGSMFGASQAVKLGMADRVDTFDSTVARLAHAPSRARVGAAASAPALLNGWTNVAAADSEPDNESGEPSGGVVPVHSTAVIDIKWDGPGEVANLNSPVTKTRGFGMFAWYDKDGNDADGDGYPDAKSDWKFEHHHVVDGEPHEAVVSACRNGLARLDEADIPAGDRAGVRAHLQRHIDDFHAHQAAAEPPALSGLAAALFVSAGHLETRRLERALSRQATTIPPRKEQTS